MHPINRVLKNIELGHETFPAAFTLRNPQTRREFDIEPEDLSATYESGGFAIRGTFPPDIKFEGRINLEADDDRVIGRVVPSRTLEDL